MIKIILTTIIIFMILIIFLLILNTKIEYFNNISILNTRYTILKDNNNNEILPHLWYKFDENNLGLNYGSYGSIYNLINQNVTLNTTNIVKGTGSASFNGRDSYLYASSSPDLNNKNISVCFWQKRNTNNLEQGTIAFGSAEANRNHFSVGIINNRLYLTCYNDDVQSDTIITSTTDWNFYTVTFNKDTLRVNLYINGVLTGGRNIGGRLNINQNRLWVGRYYNQYVSGSGVWTNSLIDDLRMYEIELTEDQVFELYAGYKKVGEVIDTSTNCMANMNSSGFINRIPDTNFDITNISAINKINDYIFNQSFNNAGITYTLTFSRYLDNDYIPTNLLSRNNKLTVFYDSINRDNYDENGNYIGIFSRNTNIIPNLNNYPQKGDFIHIRLTSSSSTSFSNIPIKLKRYGFTADAQRPSRAPGTWALYAGTRLLEPSNTNRTLLVNNTTRLNNNSYCSANVHTYIHDISANETSANELLFIFTSLADFGRNNNSGGVLSFMNLLLFTS